MSTLSSTRKSLRLPSSILYTHRCVYAVLHSGHFLRCFDQLRMQLQQNGWSQPRTSATSIGLMLEWQMAHMTPSSSSPLSAAPTSAPSRLASAASAAAMRASASIAAATSGDAHTLWPTAAGAELAMRTAHAVSSLARVSRSAMAIGADTDAALEPDGCGPHALQPSSCGVAEAAAHARLPAAPSDDGAGAAVCSRKAGTWLRQPPHAPQGREAAARLGASTSGVGRLP
mmetsp:Transcript_10615/g.22557  ORF Transcript_10615/g.22557 Transcript_10615/m.22557 type:complete len:229 (-) Transcript_10615:814-1500(-)